MNLDNFLYSINSLITMDVSKEDGFIPFLDKLKYRKIKKNEYLLREKNICRSVFFVSQGMLRTSIITKNGNEITTNFFQENEYVSEYNSFLKNAPAQYNIQVLEDAILVELTKDTIEWSYTHTSIGNIIGRRIVEELLIKIVTRKHSLLLEKPLEQYLNLIKTIPNIHNRVKQKDIASFLGITPIHLSRLKAQRKNFKTE